MCDPDYSNMVKNYVHKAMRSRYVMRVYLQVLVHEVRVQFPGYMNIPAVVEICLASNL